MRKNIEDLRELEELKEHALALMKNAGYPVSVQVAVELDVNLPFMGYTTERDGRPVIVVSGDALASGAAINLMIHELSHVYRSLTNHPSHDYSLITSITAWVMHGQAIQDYQERILHTILNHLQDIYADDIAFKIFDELVSDLEIIEFFMSWIHAPHKNAKTPKKVWENADALLSTAFAQANLQRHNIADRGGKVEKAVDAFLSTQQKSLVDHYPFFKRFMLLLPENVTRKEYEKLLISYLSEFLKLTKSQ